MNKKIIPAVIVVEGKTDKDLLESFLTCDIVTTNGSEVSRATIDLIQSLAQKRKIIILTDPDAPGKRIRDIINANVHGCLNAFVDKKRCLKKGKLGIAESDRDSILAALEHLIPNEPSPVSDLTYADLFKLGLLGSEGSSFKRSRLEEKLKLGHANGKTLYKRLVALGVSKESLEKFLDD